MLPLIIVISISICLIIALIVFIAKNYAGPSKVSNIQKLLKEGKIQAAQKLAKIILSKDQRNYIAHYWLGKAYIADNKPELAYHEFKIVNENMIFNGDIPEIEFRKQIAELYAKYNQPDESLKEYLLLTKLEPNNPDNDYNVGKIYEAKGQASLAMGFYQKALTINKTHSKSLTAMGYLLYRSKQYNEAKKTIDLAIKTNPNNYSNYYYLGKILKDGKDLSAAEKAFEKSKRDPAFKQKALIEKGSCLLLAGQIDHAINEFDIAIKCTKDEASKETLFARYFLASCYEKIRKIEKAIEQWEKIYSLNKQFKDVGSKLNQYKDIQTNDGMKEYLTSSTANFVEICKKIALVGFNIQCQKCEPTKFGCSMLATEEKNENGLSFRHQVFLVQFYRETEPLEDSVVRKVVDTVKTQGYLKGIIVTSSTFTQSAITYAENRSVVLVTKQQLETIFRKAGL